MCRATGSSGSSASQVSKIRLASSNLTQRAVCHCEQTARIAVHRPQGDRLAEAGRRLLGPVQAVEQDAEVGVGVGVRGVQRDGGAIRRLRIDRMAGHAKQHAQVAMGVGVIGSDRNRAAVRLDGLIEPAGGLMNQAQVAAGVRVTWREAQALFDESDGFVALSLLVRQHAGKVQRARVARLALEDVPEQLRRLDQPAVLLKHDRELDRALQGQLDGLPFRPLHATRCLPSAQTPLAAPVSSGSAGRRSDHSSELWG